MNVDAESGRLDLDERYTVRPEDLRGGSGILQQFGVGLRPTYRDLITQMIATSDNTATDIVIGRVGLDRVNELLAELGYEQTRLQLTTGDIFRGIWVRADSSNAGMTDREVYEGGIPRMDADLMFDMEGDPSMWLGRTTAREMSRLLEQMLGEELTTPEHAAEMFDIMDGQMYTSRIPRLLRFDARVANKTGDWGVHAGNDVAVLFYEGGPTILSVFTNQNRGDFYELEEAVGRIARDLVEAWR